MAAIQYKKITDLKPVILKYTSKVNEQIKTRSNFFNNGLSYFNIEGIENFQDIAINKGTCFILTSAVPLQKIFTQSTKLFFGKLPGSIQIQSQQSTTRFANYDEELNVIFSSLTPGNFLIYPVKNTNKIEIKFNNKFLQIDKQYPYQVRLSDKSLDPVNIYRQQFDYTYTENGLITIQTLTDQGKRYLAFTSDGTLKATGIMLNTAPVHNYFLRAIPITTNQIDYNFEPANSWITYFQDFETQAENGSVTIKDNFQNTPIHFLIDFPIKKITTTGTSDINIANLKTNFTPAGGPAPVNNKLQLL